MKLLNLSIMLPGTKFTNSQDDNIWCNILSGNNAGVYMSILGGYTIIEEYAFAIVVQ